MLFSRKGVPIKGRLLYDVFPCLLHVYGYLQVDEDNVDRHKGERRVRGLEEETESVAGSIATESEVSMDTQDSGDIQELENDSDTASETSETLVEKLEGASVQDTELNSDSLNGTEAICDTEDAKTRQLEHSGSDVSKGIITEDPNKSESGSQVGKPEATESKGEIEATKVEEPENEMQQEEEKEEAEALFPDTEIGLQHIKGDR